MAIDEILSTEAAKAVGPHNEDEDWKLDLELQIKHLADPEKAAPLVALLRGDPQLRQILTDYREADKAALAAQRRYKWLGRLGIVATFFATIIGGLYAFPFAPILEQPANRTLLLVIEIILFGLIYLVRGWSGVQNYHRQYRNARSKAETLRLSLFERVLAGKTNDTSLLPWKLEYFRRFLFIDQLAYYTDAADRDRFRSERAKIIRNFGQAIKLIAVIACIPTILLIAQKGGYIVLPLLEELKVNWTGLTHFSGLADRYLLGIGVVVSAIHTLTTEDTRLLVADRNASSFRQMADLLEAQREANLEPVRAAAASGDRVAVERFISTITAELREEQRGWALVQDYKAKGM